MQEISMNVLDVVQNSIAAGASLVQIDMLEDTKADTLTVNITDNGSGMTEEQVKRVTDPFYTTRTTRKVGLGIPLFKMAAEMTGGHLSVNSRLGEGTVITAVFTLNHIDRMPVGDMTATILALISGAPAVDYVYRHEINGRVSVLDTREIKQILGDDVPINRPEILAWIKENLMEM